MTRRSFLTTTTAGFAAMAMPSIARARWAPSGPVTLVVPFTPGGSTDILARLLGQKLTEALGVGFVIESRPGAGGAIASDLVARARPNGQTLLMGHIGTLAVNPSIYPRLPYDPVKSFAPISLVAAVHNVLVVHPSLPANSVPELIAHARANPDRLSYGTGGIGSAAHIAMAAFCLSAGVTMQHVPYRGTGPAVTDLLGARIQLTMTGAPVVLPLAQAGRLRGLAVSGKRRIAAAPELPTVAEAALPGFDASQWYGIVAPAGTPVDVVETLNAEIRKALAAPELAERLNQEGAEVWPTSPEEFRAHIAAEIARWATVVRDAGIRIEQ
ncbi:tripartite tricarboxylate transporter substrate binding protein [Phreatobacter aquaticus]|uniref:Tripartite tricarboxylate transporter substrate binding protein n=1 Tax=Phreatobacter aquaticus TaxID=2570229 RepID=A0A4D7QGK0_9HYPH|nr:tripartite tricarboxylate transporter substrate binding protein [Phreatobacter aquaticus]QCK84584.1 tripartite tricarboxylate transporter substrate binding protein [Phreatobacter aquaticus]